MVSKSHLAPVPSIPDEEVWAAGAEKRYEQGEINLSQAKEISGISPTEHVSDTESLPGLVSNLGQTASSAQTHLELVTPEHVSQPSAQRESSYVPPKAVTRAEKTARDLDEARKNQGVVPLGHDPVSPRIVK